MSDADWRQGLRALRANLESVPPEMLEEVVQSWLRAPGNRERVVSQWMLAQGEEPLTPEENTRLRDAWRDTTIQLSEPQAERIARILSLIAGLAWDRRWAMERAREDEERREAREAAQRAEAERRARFEASCVASVKIEEKPKEDWQRLDGQLAQIKVGAYLQMDNTWPTSETNRLRTYLRRNWPRLRMSLQNKKIYIYRDEEKT